MDNVKTCQDIADTLHFIAIGTEWINKDGELVGLNELTSEEIQIINEQNGDPNHDPDEGIRRAEMGDYLDDGSIYNLQYLVSADKEFLHCRIMVACGGPNIWIDTLEGKVCLYWYADYAEYPLTDEAIKAVDGFMEEVYNC